VGTHHVPVRGEAADRTLEHAPIRLTVCATHRARARGSTDAGFLVFGAG
jgi:hypothetical protein